jgi:hypothetical protein
MNGEADRVAIIPIRAVLISRGGSGPAVSHERCAAVLLLKNPAGEESNLRMFLPARGNLVQAVHELKSARGP